VTDRETASPVDSTDEAEKAPGYMTVEALVRAQLSTALGGRRGIVEGALPTLGFTVTWISTHDLQLSLVIAGALAVVLLVVRLAQRSTVQFVFNSMVGIAIASIFALRSGRAEDAFLPGLIYNSVYAVVLSGSALVRWPLVGFMIGGVSGDPVGWHDDKHLVALCSKLTWLLAAPCVVRVIVQYPLWAAHEAGWLGVAKLAMGWPLQLAALAGMAWVLNRDSTPIPVKRGVVAHEAARDPAT
jgi:hypothetical protein